MKINYLDAHTHLTDEAFDQDRQACIDRIKEQGIIRVNLIGDYQHTTLAALSLQQQHPQLFDVSCGLHPVSIPEYTLEDFEFFKKMIFDPRIICVGEIGLDYHWYPETKELQKKWFIQQIEWANQAQKPIMIHCRDAIGDCYEIIKNHRPQYGCIFHSYSGSVEMAHELIKLGCMLSFGGPVTFKNAKVPKEVVVAIPLTHLLTETDAPYLTPTPYRGKRNEPAYVQYTANEIAQLRGISVQELTKQVIENYQRIMKVKLELD